MLNQLNIIGTVIDVEELNGKLYMTGSFSFVNGEYRKGFAVIDLSTGELDPLTATLVPSSTYVTSGDGNIFVAGSFASINGVSIRGLAKLNVADGSNSWEAVLTEEQFSGSSQLYVNRITYHEASKTVYASGKIIGTATLNNGSTFSTNVAIGFNETTSQPVEIPDISTVTIQNPAFMDIEVNPDDDILYISNHPNVSAFDIDPTQGKLTQNFSFSYQATSGPSGSNGIATYPILIRYLDSKLYVDGFGSNYGIEEISPTTGVPTGNPKILHFKQAYQGDAGSLDVVKIDNTLMIVGSYTHIGVDSFTSDKSENGNPSFAVIDLSTGNFISQKILFRSIRLLTLGPNGPQPDYQPMFIYKIFLHEGKAHLFGSITQVDGVEYTSSHYIVNLSGERIQKTMNMKMLV